MIGPRLMSSLAAVMFFFSGAAGLGSQIVWAKMFALGLGHEVPATLAVVAAFMGGLALGAWRLDHVVSRSERPGLWYARLEGVIGLWSIALAFGIPLVNQLALVWIGLEPPPWRHWAIAFTVPGLALLPATMAMGATLPAVERFIAPLRAHGGVVGTLYGLNTAGAALGALVSAFWLMPALGFRRTALVFGGLNLLCGAVAFVLAREREKLGREPSSLLIAGEVTRLTLSSKINRQSKSPHAAIRSLKGPLDRWRTPVTLFVTGLLGIGYEVLGVRVLAQILENTIYTFVSVLVVYLIGTALGAGLYQRFFCHRSSPHLLTTLLCALASSCLLGILALPQITHWYSWCRTSWGDGIATVALAEMAAASLVFLLPTMMMGATFSHLVQNEKRPDGGIGRAVGVNTLGAALAPLTFGVGLLPVLGTKASLVLVAMAYLILIPGSLRSRWWLLLLPVSLLIPTALADWRSIQSPEQTRTIFYHEGVMASVSVVEDATRQRTLLVNRRFQMGGTAATSTERRHAQIPLLLHPEPKRALFLGLGTGITLGAAASHAALETDGVELLPEVIEAMRLFSPENSDPQRHPRLHPYVADARRFVRTTQRHYDVIVSDLFHPAMDGAGTLYTREHFQVIRQRLTPGGLFCQWLPFYQLDEPMLRLITRTFLEVFPHAQGWLLRFNLDTPVIGLIGLPDSPQWSPGWVERRLAQPGLAQHLKQLVLSDSVQLFGCILADAESLAAFAKEGPLNTDDFPRVVFDAPKANYPKGSPPQERLLSLLGVLRFDPRACFSDANGETQRLRERVNAFVAARDFYLRGLAAEGNGQLIEAAETYLASVRTSADFTWSYARCITIANLYARTDRPRARALLEQLVEAQPSQSVARDVLTKLQQE